MGTVPNCDPPTGNLPGQQNTDSNSVVNGKFNQEMGTNVMQKLFGAILLGVGLSTPYFK